MSVHDLIQRAKQRQALQLDKSRPLWIPQETVGKEDSTGFIPVESSWIAGLKYTPERGSEMTVKKGGKNYSYPGFNLAMFRRWVKAKSKGKWWWRNIGYPMQNSRWVGPVHPMFANGADGPIVPTGASTHSPEEALNFLKTINPNATHEHLAALGRWLPGTQSHIAIRKGFIKSDPGYLSISTNDPVHNYGSSVKITPGWGGSPHGVENELFTIDKKRGNPYRGASAPVLLRQMRAAFEMGMPRLDWHASIDTLPSIGDPYTGGVHWPLLGANGYVPDNWLQDKLSSPTSAAAIKHANMMSKGALLNAPKYFSTFEHLFKSPLAKQLWMSDPQEHQSFVDTHPGSYSRRAVERHVAENAARFGYPTPISDEQLPKVHLSKEHFRWGEHINHLFHTGSLHPDHFDSYFEN